jgi:hypothetical protein
VADFTSPSLGRGHNASCGGPVCQCIGVLHVRNYASRSAWAHVNSGMTLRAALSGIGLRTRLLRCPLWLLSIMDEGAAAGSQASRLRPLWTHDARRLPPPQAAASSSQRCGVIGRPARQHQRRCVARPDKIFRCPNAAALALKTNTIALSVSGGKVLLVQI